MPDNEVEEMTSQVARSGQFLVLTFVKTKDRLETDEASAVVRSKSIEHWFFKVQAARELKIRPLNAGASIAGFKQTTQGNQDPFLDPEEGTTAIPLVDQNGNEVLRNDNDDWLVYHISTTPLQEDIRVYPQVPDSQPGGVLEYLGSNRPAGIEGDPIGYVDGNDNPSFYDPEAGVAETLAWNSGSNTDLAYQFYNANSERRITPKLNIFGAGYVLTPITDNGVKRQILEGAINNHQAVTHIQWGAIRESFSYSVPDEWEAVGNFLEGNQPFIPEMFRPDTSGNGDSSGSSQSETDALPDPAMTDENGGSY
jgi:hypothetical protein